MSEDTAPISEDDYSEISAEVVESPQPEALTRESFWMRLRNRLGWSVNPRQQRLEDLFSAIAANPDSPTNYVLRAELYLQKGEYELAIDDFEIAQKLASERLAVDNWGLIAQVMQDRALVGLAQAKRRLEKRQ
jgi:tetratricopeptide (TPR) repeat protein